VNQRVASRMLSHMGYTVDVAVNGLEALKALEKKHYDLVFMDIQVQYCMLWALERRNITTSSLWTSRYCIVLHALGSGQVTG